MKTIRYTKSALSPPTLLKWHLDPDVLRGHHGTYQRDIRYLVAVGSDHRVPACAMARPCWRNRLPRCKSARRRLKNIYNTHTRTLTKTHAWHFCIFKKKFNNNIGLSLLLWNRARRRRRRVGGDPERASDRIVNFLPTIGRCRAILRTNTEFCTQ